MILYRKLGSKAIVQRFTHLHILVQHFTTFYKISRVFSIRRITRKSTPIYWTIISLISLRYMIYFTDRTNFGCMWSCTNCESLIKRASMQPGHTSGRRWETVLDLCSFVIRKYWKWKTFSVKLYSMLWFKKTSIWRSNDKISKFPRSKL